MELEKSVGFEFRQLSAFFQAVSPVTEKIQRDQPWRTDRR